MDVTKALEKLSKTADELEGKLTICAYRTRTQLPVTCRCYTDDKNGLLYTGQGKSGYFETLTADEKNDLPFIFTSDTSYVLEDGKVIDLDNAYEAAIWKWLRFHPFLSLDRELGAHQNGVSFYIANAKKEATKRITETEKIDEARYQLRKLSPDKQRDVARAIGFGNPEAMSDAELVDYLRNSASTNEGAAAILNAIDPANKAKTNAKIFYDKIVRYEVIERGKDGVFYFGGQETGVNIGYTPELVIEYLLTPENAERVRAMRTMLTEKTKTVEV